MISEKLIEEAKNLMYVNAKEFGAPAVFHVDLSNKKGQELARKLGADSNVVLLGTTLMDCMLGPAMRDKRLADHVWMSKEKTQELIEKHNDVDEKEKNNILYCVQEHHGVGEFYSLESEICCNADCYRFISIEGVLGGAMDFREITVTGFVKLFLEKAEEKWGALSLDVCKKELEPQYNVIKAFLSAYKEVE